MAYINGRYLADRYDSNQYLLIRQLSGDTFLVEYQCSDGPPTFHIRWKATIGGYDTSGEVTQSLPFGSPILISEIPSGDWFVTAFVSLLAAARDTLSRFARMKGLRPY